MTISSILRIVAANFVCAWTVAFGADQVESKENEKKWMIMVLGGRLTDNVWEESINPEKTEWIDSFIAGVAVARDFAHKGNFDFGWELQLFLHFGDQNH